MKTTIAPSGQLNIRVSEDTRAAFELAKQNTMAWTLSDTVKRCLLIVAYLDRNEAVRLLQAAMVAHRDVPSVERSDAVG